MTYAEYEALMDYILYAFKSGDLTESHLEDEMEILQNEWEEYGEE